MAQLHQVVANLVEETQKVKNQKKEWEAQLFDLDTKTLEDLYASLKDVRSELFDVASDILGVLNGRILKLGK